MYSLPLTLYKTKPYEQARGTVFAPELDAIRISKQHERKLAPCLQPTYPRGQIVFNS